MTKNYTYSEKQTGDTLSASEWNALGQDVDALVNGVNNGTIGGGNSGSGDSVVSATEDTTATDPTVNVSIASGVSAVGSPNVIQLTKKKKGVNTTIVSGNNVNIEPRESAGETKGGNISFKPGDDIEFCSHHRLESNQDEVSMKIINGDDEPVKLQVNAASMTLTTKGKTGNDANVLDVNINSNKNTKGYLKVRAQAIDLRCEDHGGIALQPKGEDSDHHMNKIKFEHGGGDGLEFGTFNTEKTSIFTDEYRFNKNGVWKMATRSKVASDKADQSDSTTTYKYVKQADDFYDIIDASDAVTTTKDIIKSASALNGQNISTSNNGRELSIDTQRATVTLLATDYYEDYGGNVIPLSSSVSDMLDELIDEHNVNINIGNRVLNTDYNIVFIDVLYSTLGSSDDNAAYNLFKSFTRKESIFLSEIEDVFAVNDSSYVQSEQNALRNNKPTIVLLSIWNNSSPIDESDPDSWGNAAEYMYLVLNVNSNTSINLNSKYVRIAAGNGATLKVGNKMCSVNDIITLIDYFKTGSGKQNGPWASNA